MARYKSVHTGAQIDSGVARALAGGEIDAALESKMEIEFLDNTDFQNPVAQAGVGGNHGSVAYALDHWILVSGTVSASSDGLTLNGTIRQIREKSIGFAVVPSIEMYSGTATITYDDTTKYCDITSSGGVIKRPHLGPGAITDWSKAPKVDHDVTLEKCKVYYQKIPAGNIFAGFLVSTTVATFSCPLMVQMRTTPTVSIADFSGSVATTSGALTASGLVSGLAMNAYFVLIATLNTNTLSSYVPTLMQFGNDLELITDIE